MTPWPKPWSGASPIAAWVNRLLNRCQQEVLLESKDFRRVQTATGYYLESKLPPSKPGSPGTSSNEVKMFVIVGALTGQDWFYGHELLPTNGSNYAFDSQLGTTFGVPGGPFIKIAKPPNIRRSIKSEIFDGQVITYAGAKSNGLNGFEDNNRMANDGQSDELQVVYPRYIAYDDPGGGKTLSGVCRTNAQCVVFAMKIPGGTGVIDSSESLTQPEQIDWLEISPSRTWAKRFLIPNQP